MPVEKAPCICTPENRRSIFGLCAKCGGADVDALKRYSDATNRVTLMHLPAPVEAAHGLATFDNVLNGLCGDALISARQVTGDVEALTCPKCAFMFVEIVTAQTAVGVRVLKRLLSK